VIAPQPGREAVPQAVLMPLTRSGLLFVVTIDAGGEHPMRGLLAGLADLGKSAGLPCRGSPTELHRGHRVAGLGRARVKRRERA
jgi:hypothetical protein